jgi:hypothetical protein
MNQRVGRRRQQGAALAMPSEYGLSAGPLAQMAGPARVSTERFIHHQRVDRLGTSPTGTTAFTVMLCVSMAVTD